MLWLRMQALINLCRKMTLELNRAFILFYCTVLHAPTFYPLCYLHLHGFYLLLSLNSCISRTANPNKPPVSGKDLKENLTTDTTLSYWYVHNCKHAWPHVRKHSTHPTYEASLSLRLHQNKKRLTAYNHQLVVLFSRTNDGITPVDVHSLTTMQFQELFWDRKKNKKQIPIYNNR